MEFVITSTFLELAEKMLCKLLYHSLSFLFYFCFAFFFFFHAHNFCFLMDLGDIFVFVSGDIFVLYISISNFIFILSRHCVNADFPIGLHRHCGTNFMKTKIFVM